MKLSKLMPAALALCCAACSANEHYKVVVPLSAEHDGAMARLENFDTGDFIDSVVVAGGEAVFEGNVANAILARVNFDGARTPVFVLESGTLTFDEETGLVSGSVLNEKMAQFNTEVRKYQEQYSVSTTDEERQQVLDGYNAFIDKTIDDNADNLVGYYLFASEKAFDLDAPGLREAFEKHPYFAGFERSKNLLEGAEKRESTQPGNKFIDFEVPQPDGSVKRLSDYAGKGKFVLVDFWASWCGPCIRQTAVLKDIYNKYKDSGRLEVLGVAVWDEVEATKQAIARHELPWDCILDAQKIPTDIYGIMGIPCIMLIGPDGTILSRDKQGDDLRNDVDAALAAE